MGAGLVPTLRRTWFEPPVAVLGLDLGRNVTPPGTETRDLSYRDTGVFRCNLSYTDNLKEKNSDSLTLVWEFELPTVLRETESVAGRVVIANTCRVGRLCPGN